MSFEITACEPCSTVSEAARNGSIMELNRLLLDGHPVDAFDNQGWRPLHEAVAENNVACLQRLLEIDGIDLNCKSFEGVTPLLISCQNNHNECAEILLKSKADPNLADHMDNFPLHEAVKSKNLDMIKLLVENACNVNCQLYCGTSPLHTSAAEGMTGICQYLLENGSSLETKEEYNITPLFTAAQFGQCECLLVLIKHAQNQGRADLVNHPAEDGATPLFLASQEGHLNCVSILLDNGADANIMTSAEPKSLPVQAALEFGHLRYIYSGEDCNAIERIVQKLLEVTNFELFQDCDCSPWYTVLTLGNHKLKKEAVELLVKHGVNVNYKHTKDMEETYTRFPKILRFLPTESMLFLKCINPLALAMIFEPGNNHSSIVSCLIKSGAHLNAQRPYEFPAIIAALEGRKIELAKMLICAGANINLYHPKLQGNFAVLLCLHQWKSLNLLLKVGAEVQTLFHESKYETALKKTTEQFKFLDSSCKSENAETITNQIIDDIASVDQEEGSQIKIIEENTSYIPFETFLVAARHVMSGSPYKVQVDTVLYKLVYFSPNVSLNEKLWTFVESNDNIQELRSLTDIPRTLSHLCRLIIRNKLGHVKLLNEDVTRTQFCLPRNIWDYIFFHEVTS